MIFFYTYVQVSELVAVVALLESSEESVHRTVVNARSCYSFTLYGKLVVVTSDHYFPDFFFSSSPSGFKCVPSLQVQRLHIRDGNAD